MGKRVSWMVIFFAVYGVILVMTYIVIPIFLPQLHIYQGYMPLFFFFPFIFGRRGARGRTYQPGGNNPTGSNGDPQAEGYDTAEWERKNARTYDEFGIPRKASLPRFWYYAGIVVVMSVALAILVFSGFIKF